MAAQRTAWLLAATLAACGAAAAPARLRVTGDRVCLRAAAAEQAEVVGQVMTGDELTAPDGPATGAWVRVVPPDAVSLWIYGELVRNGSVAVDRAQVRGGPGLQFKRVGELARGTPVTARGTFGDWLKIAPPPGSALWISRAYVEPLAPPAAAVAALPLSAPAVTNALAVAPPPPPVAPPEPLPTVAPVAEVEQGTPLSTARVAPLPPALSCWVADPLRPQNAEARFEGRLVRSSRAAAYRPGRHEILAADGRGPRRCALPPGRSRRPVGGAVRDSRGRTRPRLASRRPGDPRAAGREPRDAGVALVFAPRSDRFPMA